MLRIYVLVAAAAFMLKEQIMSKPRDERGLGTLEMVVIGLGLLLFATAAIAVFKGAIDTRLEKIK